MTVYTYKVFLLKEYGNNIIANIAVYALTCKFTEEYILVLSVPFSYIIIDYIRYVNIWEYIIFITDISNLLY